MEKVIYNTRFKKPIFENSTYVAVLRDNTIETRTATEEDAKDKNVIERFLTRAGAVKFIKKNPAKALLPKKTAEELEEERLAALHPFEQLTSVTDQASWDKWITRNGITFSTDGNAFKIIKGTAVLLNLNWSTNNMGSCCGGKEQGNHNGSIDPNGSRYFNPAIFTTIVKYTLEEFEEAMVNSFSNFGVVSYVKDEGNFTTPSGRIGAYLAASTKFKKACDFINPNTNNKLGLYTISEAWQGQEDEFLTDEDDFEDDEDDNDF